MSDMKVRQILIYRNGNDTPINLYDKSTIKDSEFTQLLSDVFSSPKISIINTSSGKVILKPSRIDAIEIIENKDDFISKNLPIDDDSVIDENTKEIEFDEEIIIEEINIDKVSLDAKEVKND